MISQYLITKSEKLIEDFSIIKLGSVKLTKFFAAKAVIVHLKKIRPYLPTIEVSSQDDIIKYINKTYLNEE